MIDPSSLCIFVVAALALLVTPGPAVLYIVTRSIDQGRLAGIVSLLGIHVGTLFHVGAAAVGVSAILATSALAFSVMKYLGAVCLIYMGVRRLLAREKHGASPPVRAARLRRIFAQGVMVNVLNPKTALFFFAFLPQFVDVARARAALQVLSLGVLFVLLGIGSDGLYALLAGSARVWLRGNPYFLRAQRYVAGGALVALGVSAAVAGAGKK